MRRMLRGLASTVLHGAWTRPIRYVLGRTFFVLRECDRALSQETARRRYQIDPTATWGFDTRLYGDGEIFMGENSYLGNNCYLLATPAGVKIAIGKHCMIAHNVHMRTEKHRHVFHLQDERVQPTLGADIVIGDSVWIGANVFITAGVSIGDNTIVGANSVVTRDIPPNTVWAGVPARLVREKSSYLGSSET